MIDYVDVSNNMDVLPSEVVYVKSGGRSNKIFMCSAYVA